jgi:hypothetical protein
MSNKPIGAILGKNLPLDPGGRPETIQVDSTSRAEGPVVGYASLFWAFVDGVGSVLEIFPSPERFDRWRQHEHNLDNEYALLFRELCSPISTGESRSATTS